MTTSSPSPEFSRSTVAQPSPAAPLLAVAPMMEWTDRHCRRLHRCYSPNARLYTEMVTTGAILHGPRDRLLAFDPLEQPLALQLGGCDPEALAECTRIAHGLGFQEVNLNVGCPSDRVQHARIGACLMAEPELVRDCCRAMRAASPLPVTVKCRLGIDHHDTAEFLFRFVDAVIESGVSSISVHARIAILKGLTPAQNRSVPPLNYARAAELKRRNPELSLYLNGGIDSATAACNLLKQTGYDGVMIGRAAYQNPWLLAQLEHRWFETPLPEHRLAPIADYLPYVEAQLAAGVRLQSITRHMLGVANGLPGARAFRRYLSERANKPGANVDTLHAALALVQSC